MSIAMNKWQNLLFDVWHKYLHVPPIIKKTKIRVFISYRREDSAGFSRAIERVLNYSIGEGKVFIDVDDILLGSNYKDHINQSIHSCDVLVVVIGKDWNPQTSNGRRLDDPNDWVRREVAAGIKRGITIIPVLLDGESMPDKQQLPNELEKLTDYEGIELISSQFNIQAEQIVNRIREVLKRPIWGLIRQWGLERKKYLLFSLIIVAIFSIIYNKEIQRVAYEGSADVLHTIDTSKLKFIGDDVNSKIRNFTIYFYDLALNQIDDDLHKARVKIKMGLEHLTLLGNHEKSVKENYTQVRDLLSCQKDGKSNDEISNEAHLLCVDVSRHFGTTAEIQANIKLTEADKMEGTGNIQKAEELRINSSELYIEAKKQYHLAIEHYRYATTTDERQWNVASREDYAELNYSLAKVLDNLVDNSADAISYYCESLKHYKIIYNDFVPPIEGMDVSIALIDTLELSACTSLNNSGNS